MATVDSLITAAQGYASSTIDLAEDAIGDMRDDIANVGFTAITFTGTTLPDAPELPEAITPPVLSPVNLELPTEPSTAIDFQDISPIVTGNLPTLDAAAPTITAPILPAQLAQFLETAPTIQTDYIFPDAPAQLIDPTIAEPSLGEYTAPTKTTIALPSFDGVAPTADLTPPSDLAGQFDGNWRTASPMFVASIKGQMDAMLTEVNPQFHTQMTAIETQLSRYLAGGTGLDPAVETAIYTRSTSKQSAEARRVSDAAWEEAASRGHTLPGGIVLAGIRKARQAASDNNAAAAREIVVMQAEMEQRNLQFAVTTSAALRQAMLSAALSYHGSLVQINGQALQYAQSVLSAVIEAYNLQVRAFEARLNAYRAETAVYDARLKAALSYIDLYRAEIDAMQALVQVDQAKVSLYKGRIDALQSLASVYKSRIESIVAQAGLEKLKLDLFKTKVDAYGVRVQAKRSEYDAYSSAWQGEEAKVRIFTSQVGAYGAQITGYRANIDAQDAVVRAQAATNQAKADQVRATTSIYETIARVRGDKARTELQVQQQQLNSFDSQTRATIATAELGATIYRTIAQVVLQNAELEVNTLLKNADLNLGRTKAVGELGIASAEVYKGIAGAAMSGMNTLVAQTLAE